jgi:L(+)-tartrate dehydratase beta subunit
VQTQLLRRLPIFALADIVYLDGTVYTAREGVYKRVLEDGIAMPMDLPADSAANFHCSPAATQHDDGSFDLGAVTATASFRFSKWIGPWLAASGAKLIIGKGGMSSKDYREHFVPHGAIYLTTGWLWHGCAFGAWCQTG